MPPKRKGGARAALHRVEHGLRRLFRNRYHTSSATESNSQSDTYPNNTDWGELERFSDKLKRDGHQFERLISSTSQFLGCVKRFENQARTREEYKKLGADLNELFGILAQRLEETEHVSMSLDTFDSLAQSIDQEMKLVASSEDSEPENDGSVTEDIDGVLRCYRRVRTLLALFVMNENTKMWRLNDDEASSMRLETLSHSSKGHYRAFGSNDIHRTVCIPNTRADVLQDLREWIQYGKFQKVYWLNGIVGTGKTTIAYSLCEYLENSGKPAASFFCDRDSPDCRDVKRIFPSVAYQLARLSRPFRCAISTALEQDPEVCTRPIDEQFQRLIATPLGSVGHTFGIDVVVVLDGLDECEDKDGVNQVLDACFKNSLGLPVRFLITSRQNLGIWIRMRANQGGQRRAELRLHEIDRTIAREDARTYLRARLERLDLSGDDLECLVQRSGGWFLYATSIVNYVGQDNSSNGVERLKRLLVVSSHTQSSEAQGIDQVYISILEESVGQFDLEDPRRAEVMLVLRTALCAREPATINTVTELLGLDFDRMVHTVLRPLLPILHGSNAGELGMTLYISFASYLTDPQRSGKFYCEVQRDNELLVQLCFKAIAGASPPFNVCRLESSYLLDREVPDVDERVDESISQAMWYACRHWATHLMLAGHSGDLLTALYEFLSTRLLLWMEVMNLKHQISQAAELLGGLHAWLHEIECPVYIRDLVLDAWKFVEAYSSSVVSASTPHIYISALLFWPVHRPVSIRCIPALQYVTKVTGTRLGRRREDIMVLTGSDTGVVRSPQVLETTPRETIDNIEPSRTGPRQSVSQSFEGHTYKVLSVAYSPDGANVASGSGDHTVRIWDTHTCQSTCQPLNGHTSGIYSVAYSPNGAYIASGSEDKTIRIWDAHTGKPVGHPLEGHTRTVNSVAYSPDGAYIVSGSDDRTVLIWNAHTGKLVVQLFDNYTDMVRSIAYSPDGAYIVAGSDDKTIRIWAPLTRQLAGQPLKGHKGPVRSVAYSPDGAYIVSGSVDMTVRIWNAHTLRPVGQPLEGHTDWVLSVVYSPDGAFIASGSWDKTVRIWDAHTGKAVGQPLVGHTGGVYSVAYSPNGAYIVSGSHDNTLRVWDSHAGHAVQLPEALLQPTWSNPRPPKHSPFPSAFARYVTHISKKPIPAINSSHKITAENLVHRWALDDQGWVVNACQKRLVWVPQDLRELVLIPPTLAIMPLGDRVILDFRDAKLGTEWDNCFDSRQIVFNESN